MNVVNNVQPVKSPVSKSPLMRGVDGGGAVGVGVGVGVAFGVGVGPLSLVFPSPAGASRRTLA